MNKVEEILGTVKAKDENWGDVFKRVNTYGGVDLKTLTKVVVYILEELDAKAKSNE